jgi:hypothetical protein
MPSPQETSPLLRPSQRGAARSCSELLGAARSCSELLGAARSTEHTADVGCASRGGLPRTGRLQVVRRRAAMSSGENYRDVFPLLSACFHTGSPGQLEQVKDHPYLRELHQSRTFPPGCNFHPSPHAAAGGWMRRLEADGHVTRFVTRTLCHAVTLGRRAETAVSPVGWSAGMSGVRVGRCETAACRLITQTL